MLMSRSVENLPWTDSRNVRTFQRLLASQSVGRRIKELRERLRPRVSQEDLADKVGVRSETISRWERGASGGYYDDEAILDKLAAALKVKPEDIVGPPAVASPGQLDRMEARLDEVQERINELRDMLRTGAAVADGERREVPPPPKGLQPVEPESERTQEGPPESETEAEGTD